MAAYSLQQVAQMYGYSLTSTKRHIAKLKEKKKFKKKSIGKYFSEHDLQSLSELLGFSLKPTKAH